MRLILDHTFEKLRVYAAGVKGSLHPGLACADSYGVTETSIRSRSPWELTIERLRNDRAAIISAAILLAVVLIAAIAPMIAKKADYRHHGIMRFINYCK
jgi:hypothetical protein